MKKIVSASRNLAALVVGFAAIPVWAGQQHSTPKPRIIHYHAPQQRSVAVPPAHVRHIRVAPKPRVVATKSVSHGPTRITVAASTPIRTGPSDAAAIIKRVPAGTPIPNILDEQNGFYEYVRYTNQHGWVAAADLEGGGTLPPPPITAPPAAKPQTASKSGDSGHRWGTSIAAASAILEAPSADARVIKTIPAGTHVPEIIGEQNGFYQYVRWTHKIAYIAVSDVRLGGGPDVAAAASEDETTTGR